MSSILLFIFFYLHQLISEVMQEVGFLLFLVYCHQARRRLFLLV